MRSSARSSSPGIATAIALPAGVLLAIFNTEFAPRRLAEAIGLTLNVLAGVPTIVIGVFIFALVVVGRGQSAFAGRSGLSIVMLPLVARATEEVLRLVPPHLREGGMALGATRARTVMTVILPTAVGGIVTATIVAVARAAGETAPLLFTTSIFVGTTVNTDPSQAMASIPMVIFSYSESARPARAAAGLGGRPRAGRDRARREHRGQVAVPSDTPPDRAGQMSRVLHIFTTATPGHNPGLSIHCDHPNEYVDRERARSRRGGGRLPAGATPPNAVAEPVAGQARRAGRAAHAGSRGAARARVAPRRRHGLVLRGAGRLRCHHGRLPLPGDRVHRPVRLRQDHAASQPQPHERPHHRRDGRRDDHVSRARPLRLGGRPRRGAAPDRHGVPAAEPVPEVDLRQRGVRPSAARHEGQPRRPRSSRRSTRPPSGTR